MNIAEKTKKIAELCWYYNAWHYKADRDGSKPRRKLLALHLNMSEGEILKIMGRPEYLVEVERLIRTRSPEAIEKWIESYKNDMPKKFGKRMGLSEEVVSELIEKVLDRLSSGE